MALFQNANYDFIKWRWHAIAVSAVIIIAGFAYAATRGVPLGIDFSGGTIVVVQFQRPVTDDEVRNALVASVPGEHVIQAYGEPSANQKQIRLPMTEGSEQGVSLEAGSRAIVDALDKAGLRPFQVINQELVGPVIGADLQRKGLLATLFSILGITAYIALRFRPAFALGAIAATFHDILVTLAFLFFMGYDLSLNVVAALLTITGYSVNDTIVIFDRVRENQRSNRRDNLETIVNRSVNQTLSRTVITAGTTFLSVLALYLFGGEVLEAFAFTMLVGIVSGTYSTVFIAAAIALLVAGKQSKGRVAGTRKAS
jgi:preprotein translocase subunit SecF